MTNQHIKMRLVCMKCLQESGLHSSSKKRFRNIHNICNKQPDKKFCSIKYCTNDKILPTRLCMEHMLLYLRFIKLKEIRSKIYI